MAEEQGITWSVITHEHKERTNDWYWTLGLGALVIVGISLWLGNMLLAVIIAISAVSVGVLVARGPREHSVRIDARGVSVDGTLYRYSSIRSFWIEQHTDSPRLFLTTAGLLSPQITLPLFELRRARQVEERLRKGGVLEEEQSPHMGEHLAQLMGL